MKDYQNQENFAGDWWIDDEHIIPGELVLNGQFFELNLNGSFYSLKEKYNSDIESVLINGITTSGKKMCLMSCSISSFNISTSGKPIESYTVGHIVVGNNYNSVEDIEIESVEFTSNLMNHWIWANRNIENMGNGFLKLQYPYDELRISAVFHNYMICITTQNRSVMTKTGDVKNTRSELISIDYFNSVDLSTCNKDIYNFNLFMSICTNIISNNSFIKLYTLDGCSLDYLYKNNRESSENIERRKFIVKFDDVFQDFERYYGYWLNKQELLEPITGYYIDAISRSQFTSIEFLKLTQALEVFHRRLRKNFKINECEFRAQLDKLILKLDTEETEWLEEVIRYKNEPTLYTRLLNLFEEVNFLLSISTSKRKKYAYKVVETRNYLTHFDALKKDKSLSIDEMLYSTRYFELILSYLLLKEMGFDVEYVQNSLKTNNSLKYIREGLGF